MEIGSRIVLLVSVVMVVIAAGLWPMAAVEGGPVLHKVGASKAWHQDINYTQWSSQEHFYVGDWLLFKFDKRYYNVLEVNKTSYESCMDWEFIRNITRGGRDVVQLTEARTYYFLSSGGYCFHGMRVAVQVEQYQQGAPAGAPSPSEMNHSGSILPYGFSTCIWIVVANVLYLNLVSLGIL